MTLIKITGASAANNYSGESNRPPPEEIARRAAAQARGGGGGALAPMINPELMQGAGTMNRLAAEMRADSVMRGVAANQQRVGDIFGAADLSKIDWPTQEHYGWEHARDTSQLAVHIAQGGRATVGCEFDLTANDIETLKSAALFHDLGREESWKAASPGHRFASAERARKLMVEDAQAWFRRDLIEVGVSDLGVELVGVDHERVAVLPAHLGAVDVEHRDGVCRTGLALGLPGRVGLLLERRGELEGESVLATGIGREVRRGGGRRLCRRTCRVSPADLGTGRTSSQPDDQSDTGDSHCQSHISSKDRVHV
jgi:hypothetical protein